MNKNFVGGLVVAVVGFGCGLWLLVHLNKISGAEFVAFSLGFAVIGLIVAFATEVQEFSIAGNGVKLRELRTEAEKTIEELKKARTETFRFLLTVIRKDVGFFDVNPFKDERIKDFWLLYEQIVKFEDVIDLRNEIILLINDLMSKQYRLLSAQNPNIPFSEYTEEIDPDHLLLLGLNIALESTNKNYLESDDFRLNMLKGVDEYRKIFQLKRNLILN